MKIGIVGAAGIVGGAMKYGFEKHGHTVIGHDLKWGTEIDCVLPTEVAYIAVPTPMHEDGSCDTSIVEEAVRSLLLKKYLGVVCIKSTVKPGTTDKLIRETGCDTICFAPEFLRERCRFVDFVEDHRLLAIGTHSDAAYDAVVRSHGSYPKKIMRMAPTEGELLKLMHNTFNGLRVVFANEFYDVCKALGADYRTIKSGFLQTSNLPDIYLDVNENAAGLRGYGGVCLNKDIPALCALAEELGLDYLNLFRTIVEENNKFKRTVFDGMREG